MRIAVNTRFLLPNKMEGFGWYTYEITKRLVEQHPEHEFFFFFDRKFDPKFIFGDNVTPIVLYPPARHPILFKIWFNHSVRRALKKYQIDVFFSPDGYLCLKTKIAQVGVIHDINFEHHPEDLPANAAKYLRTYFPKFAEKANHILTVSNYSKSDIVSTYNISSDKVTVAWNGASEAFKPLNDTEKKVIKLEYANGNPYLLFVGALHPRKNVLRLIEAFDLFVQNNPKSSYQLVIVGEAMWDQLSEQVTMSGLVRDRIHFTGHLPLDQLAKLMGGADVFTFIPYFEGFGIPLVEAMKCGTPILSGDRTSLPEVAGDAALYCNPFDVQDITNKITSIVLDDQLKKSLSSKGLERSKLFSWDNSAEVVWGILQQYIT